MTTGRINQVTIQNYSAWPHHSWMSPGLLSSSDWFLPFPEDEHPTGAPIYSPTMNSPGLQQRTRCSRSHGIGSLLLVHPLSSDETRVSPLQKGTTFPKILLLIKYPYGLSFLLWPYRDVHTFPMRYVTVLACEHSYPPCTQIWSLDLKQLDTLAIRTRVPKQLDTLAIRTRQSSQGQIIKQLDTPAIRTSFPRIWTLQLSAQEILSSKSKDTETHPRSINSSGEAGRPGLCPVKPISSGLLYGTLRHPSRLHDTWAHHRSTRKINKTVTCAYGHGKNHLEHCPGQVHPMSPAA